ncbi:baseplate J/gp47 family protein [Nodosilinea sp. E11]|uniref:baseplate J/gp47 family protein n=1 Tax=Nodosilinea sp. E11 TaxID=3037479 RepID=UPI00293532BD|nr:baseplate J/gp47 family protein [Nodosilinea sp. E11]WOD39722.1 baseplate J/gp47 family protein [Nodosilinea sp. E11]
MSYSPRLYPDIVRDLLTVLTGGTVRESLTMPGGDDPILLNRRPVRRISHLQGQVAGRLPDQQIAYRFTPADFELISTTGRETEKDAIRFRPEGRRPIAGTPLTVNYYPMQTDPVPVTDLNVGSVARTLMETFGRELAVSELNLELVYKSAFLETAEGNALDRVVALVGVTRLPTGNPVVRLRFSRQEGTVGRITIPAGTAVVSASGARYLTLDSLTLEPGETSRDVLAGGENQGTEPVETGELNRPEVLIAGIVGVTNGQPAHRLSVPETDDDLRRRTRSALTGAVRGTLDAIRFGLKSLEGIKDVAIADPDTDPTLRPGEIRVEVAYSEDTPAKREEVRQRLEDLKPAGVRVLVGRATSKRLDVRVEKLVLAGSSLPAAEQTSVVETLKQRLLGYFSQIAPGGQIRRAQLLAIALSDARIVDATLRLVPEGGTAVDDLTLGSGEVLEVTSDRIQIQTIKYERAAAATAATTTTVSIVLPVHLLPGVTVANATTAINAAVTSHVQGRNANAPLTVDGLAATIRDESRFALIRHEATITLETADRRFLQLRDGVGEYRPAPVETLQIDAIEIDVREGQV